MRLYPRAVCVRPEVIAGCSGDVDRIMVDARGKSGERGYCGEERADQRCAEHGLICALPPR